MTFIPQRIHKDKPVASKLHNLAPTSLLGQWSWELRGDFYYPVIRDDDPAPNQELIDEIRRRQRTIVSKGKYAHIPFHIIIPAGTLLLGMVLQWLLS